MFRNSIGRVATVSIAVLLALMLVGVGSVAAKTPGWQFRDAFNGGSLVTASSPFIGSPATVSPGSYVAFNVTLKNGGRSNISAAYLSTDYADDDPLGFPAYVGDAHWSGQTGPTRPCDPYLDAKLDCVLGDITAGASVTILIVFTASESTGPESFNFLATGNGNTPSDGGGTSHGDFLKGPARYVVSDDPEFAAGFVLNNGAAFSTTGSLSRSNAQNTTVESFEQYQAVTIQDSATITGTDPCASSGVNCIGQWARLTAPNPNGGLFKVILLIYGRNIPGSVGPEDIVLYHTGTGTGDDGIIGDEPSERCTSESDSASAPCIWVEEVGSNFRVVAWLIHNGGLHSAY